MRRGAKFHGCGAASNRGAARCHLPLFLTARETREVRFSRMSPPGRFSTMNSRPASALPR